MIRPYKGLPDAVEAVLGVPGARLLVAGDPRVPLDDLRRAAGDRAEWRLGYLGESEIAAALSETTVAVFPYRAELDQSGALLQVIGAGIPAVVYDVGGLGEVVAAYGAGRVVAPGDVDGLTAAVRELLDDEDALAAARAGAERRAGGADVGARCRGASGALRGAGVRFRRKGRFSELVERQLDLFAADDAELLAEAAEAEGAWNAAAAEDAEEAYGDYQLVVDAIADRLLDIRESYAHTLDEEAASEYSAAFTREATRRYRRYATLLADLED